MQYRITFSEVTTTHNTSLPTEDIAYTSITRKHIVKTNERNLDREIEYYTQEVGLQVISIEYRNNSSEEWRKQ
jgi:hypothetical protein